MSQSSSEFITYYKKCVSIAKAEARRRKCSYNHASVSDETFHLDLDNEECRYSVSIYKVSKGKTWDVSITVTIEDLIMFDGDEYSVQWLEYGDD